METPKMLVNMTTEERGNMTIDQFTAEYGYTIEDIKQLGWLRREGSLDAPTWHCVGGNDCPASLIFFDPVWLDVPEIRKPYAPVLAEIIKRMKHVGESFHCFTWDGNCIICLSNGESLRVQRFFLDVYKKQYYGNK